MDSPQPSSIFKTKSNTIIKAHQKRNNMINFQKYARCTLTPLSLRSARLTQYMRSLVALRSPYFARSSQNIAYTEMLAEIYF